MTPIEKAQAKSAALNTLGLSGHAAPGEIRAAWKRMAFETHPDRNGGALDAFAEARAAYDLLAGETSGVAAQAGCGSRGSRERAARASVGPRPRVAARVDEFSAEILERCRTLLEAGTGARESGGDGTETMQETTDHVARAVQREGRCLTYVVTTPLAAGANRVALPTAVLEDPRKVRPKVVTFRSGESGPGEVAIPDGARMRLFPGARSVRIRFANG